MNRNILWVIVVLIIVGGLWYWFGDRGAEVVDYDPVINPEDFTNIVDNPYFQLTPGRKLTYEGQTAEGLERIEVVTLDEAKQVMGVGVVTVWDRVWLEDSLIEETKDWYAQDEEGNVWYFGEDTAEYEDGKILNHHGAWEAGIDGAKPGIIMPANPEVGQIYREEYYQGEAEDMAEVISLTESVAVPFGSFTNCLQTKNYTPLEPGIFEYKYYCSDVGGTALETNPESGERVELVSIEG